MGLFTEHVIPGNHGAIFTTNAKSKEDLEDILEILTGIEGIQDAMYNDEVFPHEITVHTTKLVKIHHIQNAVRSTSFHLVPKTLFGLNR